MPYFKIHGVSKLGNTTHIYVYASSLYAHTYSDVCLHFPLDVISEALPPTVMLAVAESSYLIWLSYDLAILIAF